MANTTRGIPYPNDYSAAADVPAALQNLAIKVDELVGAVDTKANTATTNAAAASTSAGNANTAVASHTHNGSGSVNIAMTAVTGLSSALTGKSDSGHLHTGVYSPVTHTHTASELAAHTHSDYAASTHQHAQSASHTSPDTDSSQAAIHHTLGTSANQAAPGNHGHSGFATTDHGHNGFAATSHSHGELSVVGHSHSYATTDHGHNGYAATGHSHSDPTSLTLQTLYVSGASVDFPGVYNAGGLSGISSLGIKADGRLRVQGSTQRIKYDIATVSKTLATCVEKDRQVQVQTIDPAAILDVAVVEFSGIDSGEPTTQRQLGFIAEDVNAKLPDAVTRDLAGNIIGVLDTQLLAALLAVVQDQQARIEALESRL